MGRVALTDGNWAELTDVDEMTNDEYDALVAEMAPVWERYAESPEAERVKQYSRARVAQLVKAWSLDEPLPSDDITSLGRIKRKDYVQLTKAANDAEARLNEEPGTDPLAVMNGSASVPSGIS